LENRKNTEIYVAYDDHDQFDPSKPEKDLLRAVLASAMSDIKKSGEPARKAREYFLDPSEEYIFSFRSICNHLELDPKTILWVVGMRESSIPKKRPNESAKELDPKLPQ